MLFRSLLVFNGTHFLQIIEGAPDAIDQLVERLRRDPRHSGFEVRDERSVEQRSFGDWTMELVLVSGSYMEARGTLSARLPPSVQPGIRERIVRMTESISGNIAL